MDFVIYDAGIFENHRLPYFYLLIANKEFVVHITSDFLVCLHDLSNTGIQKVIERVNLLFHKTSILVDKKQSSIPYSHEFRN